MTLENYEIRVSTKIRSLVERAEHFAFEMRRNACPVTHLNHYGAGISGLIALADWYQRQEDRKDSMLLCGVDGCPGHLRDRGLPVKTCMPKGDSR